MANMSPPRLGRRLRDEGELGTCWLAERALWSATKGKARGLTRATR